MSKKEPKVLSLKERILAADDTPIEVVEVPEWGTAGQPLLVNVATMTGTQRDAFEASIAPPQTSKKKRGKGGAPTSRLDMTNIRARCVAICIVDDEGNRVFGDSDIEALGKKSSKALDRVFEVVQRLIGLTDDDLEELVGNSDGDQNAVTT